MLTTLTFLRYQEVICHVNAYSCNIYVSTVNSIQGGLLLALAKHQGGCSDYVLVGLWLSNRWYG